ncbi:blue (type1) copper protein [groundwater metagenome]
MVDKCPKCGETLITRTIQKKLDHGSIDFPVAEICPKCNWSRDLTGAGDIVVKPHANEAGVKKEKKPGVVSQAPEKPKHVPEKTRPCPSASTQRVPDMNKIITIALALLVIAGIIWAFMPKVPEQSGGIQPTPTSTPIVTASATVAATATPEVTRTGNNITVKLDRDRGFFVPAQSNLKIKQGDGVVWINDGVYSFTIVSNDGLFEDKVLDNDKRTTYIFKKSGTYTFDIIVNGVKKFSGTVVVEP